MGGILLRPLRKGKVLKVFEDESFFAALATCAAEGNMELGKIYLVIQGSV